MDMQHVRFFLAVSETLNFTRAAELCGVSQPTLTRSVKALEAELGGDLLRREGRTSHLTELGERMLPFLRRSFENAQLARDLARAMGDQDVLPLSVGIATSLNLEPFMHAFAALYRRFPGLQLRIIRGSNDAMADLLRDGGADIALAGPLSHGWDRLERAELFEEPVVVFLPPGHALREAEMLTPASLAGAPFFISVGCDMRERVGDWLGAHVDGYRGASEFDDSAHMAAVIEETGGVLIAPESASVAPGFMRRGCAGLDLHRVVNAYSVAGRPRSITACTLLNTLRATASAPARAA